VSDELISLSERETELLRLVATGATNQQIAQELVISVNTVKVHLRNIYAKRGVASRTEATMVAVREGWVAVPGHAGDADEERGLDDTPAIPPPTVPSREQWSYVSVGKRASLVVALLLAVGALFLPLVLDGRADSQALNPINNVFPTAPAGPTTTRWHTRAQMPTPRTGLAVVAHEELVYAIGGVGIAGDVFDRRIIEGTLLEHFGRGSTWGPDAERFPDAYTDALGNWQTVLELNTPDTLRFLRWAQTTSSHPTRVHALESLLVNNYIALLFDEAERAKASLSERHFCPIRLRGEGIQIWQPLSRTQFELLIAENAKQIEACLLNTLNRAGLEVSEIDAVVRTGGSAQIPLFVQMLERIFGSEKVVLTDVFGSVTAGLAIHAAQRTQP